MPPPRKKDRLRGSLSSLREQFPPTGTLYGGQAELPGKSCPDEGAKTAPGGSRELCADCAHEETAGNGGVWCREASHWAPAGAEGTPGRKNSPGRGAGDCVQAAPMGERRTSCAGWCREATSRAARRGRGHARAQKQPRRGPEAVWMRDMGVTCPGRSV